MGQFIRPLLETIVSLAIKNFVKENLPLSMSNYPNTRLSMIALNIMYINL